MTEGGGAEVEEGAGRGGGKEGVQGDADSDALRVLNADSGALRVLNADAAVLA